MACLGGGSSCIFPTSPAKLLWDQNCRRCQLYVRQFSLLFHRLMLACVVVCCHHHHPTIRFVREDTTAISYSCLSPCVYERDDQPGTAFCFAQGDQQVVMLVSLLVLSGYQPINDDMMKCWGGKMPTTSRYVIFECWINSTLLNHLFPRWSAATTPQEPRVSIHHLHLSQKLMKNQVWCFFHLISDESSQSHTHRQSQCLCPCLSCPVQVFGGSEISDKIPRVGLFKLQYSLVAMYPPIFNKKIVCPICFQVFFPTSIIVVTTSLISQQIYSSHPFAFFFLKKLCSTFWSSLNTSPYLRMPKCLCSQKIAFTCLKYAIWKFTLYFAFEEEKSVKTSLICVVSTMFFLKHPQQAHKAQSMQ